MDAQRGNAWMWSEACALLEAAERRQRRFFDLLTGPAAAPAWEPPANIFARDAELHIELALPGASLDQVVVQLTPAGLLIETTVPPPAMGGTNVVRLEIPYGLMRRRIDLPAGRYALREHRMEHGCLFLRLTRSIL